MMNRSKFIIFSIILLMSIPYTYGGCVVVFTSGNVDRQRDLNVNNTSPDADDRTAQAIIDSNNATDLSRSAFAGGIARIETAATGFNQESMVTQIGVFRPLRLPLVLQDSLQKVGTVPKAVAFFEPAVETKKGTLLGDCGGELSYLVDFIVESGIANGSFSFEKYCDHGITISGEMDVDGTYGIDSGEFITAQFSFAELTDGHITLDGEISIDFTHPQISATLSAHSKDTESGKVYRIEDYAMNITEFAGYVEIEIFGTFYHPDHGFVNLTTTEPFIVHHEDDWPTSGLLVLGGEKNTQAELSALNQLSFSVTADTDGDGMLDWQSGILTWADR